MGHPASRPFTVQPYLVSKALRLLRKEVHGSALGQKDGSVRGGGGPRPALVLMQYGGEATVLRSLPEEMGAAFLGVQGAAFGPAAAAVQAGPSLDGRAGADLLQHPVEGSGAHREVMQGHGVGDPVHLRGAFFLVRGVVVRHPVVQRQRVLGVLVLPLPGPPAAVEKVLQAMAKHGAFGQLLNFL